MPEATDTLKTIAVIGEQDLAPGFRALGFDVQIARTAQDVFPLAQGLARKGCAVCLIQDDLYQAIQEAIPAKKGSAFPIFIPFCRDGTTAFLSTMIRAIRLRATGTL